MKTGDMSCISLPPFLSHSLAVEWTVDPPVQDNCEEYFPESSPPGTEIHLRCFDTSTWNKPALYTITLKATDYANPGDADLDDYENRWVKENYQYVECNAAGDRIINEYSFTDNMVFTLEFNVIVPEV